MSPFPRALLAQARLQLGLVTVGQLDDARLTGRRRGALLDGGVLVVVHRGVYRIATHAESFEQRCLAALLAAPDCVVSGPSAGRLLGLRKTHTNEVHVLATRAIDLAGVVGHRTNFLRPIDHRSSGPFRLLRPARLVCDLAAFLSDDDLESVIEQVLDRRLASLSLLRDVARLFVASGRNGTARIARVLDSRADWIRPVDSDLELQLLRAMRRQGVELEAQVPVVLDSGRTVYIDLALPALRVGIEVDHVEWHGGRLSTQQDKIRDRELMRLGWTVARVTDDDVVRRLDETVRQLVAIVELARARLAA